MYGEGVSREAGLIDMGVDLNIVDKSGSWFSYGDQRLGQGRDNARLYLRDNPQLSQEIEERILTHYGLMTPIAGAPGRAETAQA